MLCDKHIGSVMSIGNTDVTITAVLTEKTKRGFNERCVMYEAVSHSSIQKVIVKARYQSDAILCYMPFTAEEPLRATPARLSYLDAPYILNAAKESFDNEHHALRECQKSGSKPRYLGHAELTQDAAEFYVGSYLRVIAMSLAVGTSVDDIEYLYGLDKEIIRDRLVPVLESVIRQCLQAC